MTDALHKKVEKEVESFDPLSLKHAETHEKNVLPSPQG